MKPVRKSAPKIRHFQSYVQYWHLFPRTHLAAKGPSNRCFGREPAEAAKIQNVTYGCPDWPAIFDRTLPDTLSTFRTVMENNLVGDALVSEVVRLQFSGSPPFVLIIVANQPQGASRHYSWRPHGGSGLPHTNPKRKRGRTATTPSLALRVSVWP